MNSVFIAVPQYKEMPEAEQKRIAVALEMKGWEPNPNLVGFHPCSDISITNLFNANHHQFWLSVVGGDGNLPRVRAYQLAIWKQLWDSGNKFNHVLVLDDDIGFEPQAVDLLIKDDKPIIGGIYTFKTQRPIYAGGVCTRFFEGEFGNTDGPFRVRWLNGGFILIRAEVLLAMIEAYKDLEFRVQGFEGIDTTFGLWTPFVHDQVFLSEDWAFSERARRAGFEVWADWRVKLSHWNGEHGFSITPTAP